LKIQLLFRLRLQSGQPKITNGFTSQMALQTPATAEIEKRLGSGSGFSKLLTPVPLQSINILKHAVDFEIFFFDDVSCHQHRPLEECLFGFHSRPTVFFNSLAKNAQCILVCVLFARYVLWTVRSVDNAGW